MAAARPLRALMVLACLAYTVSVIPAVRAAVTFPQVWDVSFNSSLPLLAAVVTGLRAARVRADRAAWACFAAGFGCYAAGVIVYGAFFANRTDVPYPSIADALWLLIYPFCLAGLGLLTRARVTGRSWSTWLDGVVSGLGLVSVAAAFVFPRITAGATGEPAAIVTNFAYPLLDLALVAVAVGALIGVRTWERSFLLIGAGFLTFAAADSWYELQVVNDSYVYGSYTDVIFMLGPILVAFAAVPRTPRARETGEETGEETGRSFLLPGCFALVALGVLVAGSATEASPFGVTIAALALAAAFARTVLTVREVVLLADSRRQAVTDALTGLPNRRALNELIAAAETGDGGAALVLVDLDRFKEINDGLGHRVGDQVLHAVSRRFSAEVPPGGTLARLGGDELALFLPGTGTEGAVAVARRLREALGRPFVLAETSLHVDASMGVTAVGSGPDAGRALAKADLAMYRAKSARTGCEVYDDARDGDAWDRLATVEALRAALDAGEGIAVEYQPICRAGDLAPAGLEALIRWDHPVRGRIPPDAFLPLAEHAGLMSRLTRAVLAHALDEALALRELGQAVPVSVNLSASDLLDTRLVDHVAEALADRGLPPSALKIEITETLLVDTAGAAGQFLFRLRELGVELAVDDYGTGYSSLAYLHDLPVSWLKIDRAFTRRLDDPRTVTIVAHTVDMAHELGLRVVAEGVETEEQLALLAGRGCDVVQGYLLGRPMRPAALHDWLARRAAPTR